MYVRHACHGEQVTVDVCDVFYDLTGYMLTIQACILTCSLALLALLALLACSGDGRRVRRLLCVDRLGSPYYTAGVWNGRDSYVHDLPPGSTLHQGTHMHGIHTYPHAHIRTHTHAHTHAHTHVCTHIHIHQGTLVKPRRAITSDSAGRSGGSDLCIRVPRGAISGGRDSHRRAR